MRHGRVVVHALGRSSEGRSSKGDTEDGDGTKSDNDGSGMSLASRALAVEEVETGSSDRKGAAGATSSINAALVDALPAVPASIIPPRPLEIVRKPSTGAASAKKLSQLLEAPSPPPPPPGGPFASPPPPFPPSPPLGGGGPPPR